VAKSIIHGVVQGAGIRSCGHDSAPSAVDDNIKIHAHATAGNDAISVEDF